MNLRNPKRIAPLSVLLASLVRMACSESSNNPNSNIAPTQQTTMNIVETAVDAGSFTTLVAALQAAGLGDDLAGPGPFTVFAPTDDAFALLPSGTIDFLLDPANNATLHVIDAVLDPADTIYNCEVNLRRPRVERGQPHYPEINNGADLYDTPVASCDGRFL